MFYVLGKRKKERLKDPEVSQTTLLLVCLFGVFVVFVVFPEAFFSSLSLPKLPQHLHTPPEKLFWGMKTWKRRELRRVKCLRRKN